MRNLIIILTTTLLLSCSIVGKRWSLGNAEFTVISKLDGEFISDYNYVYLMEDDLGTIVAIPEDDSTTQVGDVFIIRRTRNMIER